MDTTLALRLIDTLPVGVPGLFNPWRDHCPDDQRHNGPETKLERLALHLDCSPRYILCGEAPGHLGCRHSGVAFTSERLLLDGSIPRIPRIHQRLTVRRLPFAEPSATIVWKTLYRLGIAEHTILWNALQMHPHKPGNHRSNRTPTKPEIALGDPALRILIDAFPYAKIVAIGKKAERLLLDMGLVPAIAVRHPANGGAVKFADGMRAFIEADRHF